MKLGSTFKIPQNIGGNGYWSILIPRVPNQVMTLKCAVMCVPLQYKPSVHHQMSRILSMNLLSSQFLIWRMTNEWTTPVISRMTRKIVANTGRARSFKNKIERRGRQNKNNGPINLPKVITFSTDFKYTTQS